MTRRVADDGVNRPLIAGDVAEAAVYMLNQPLNVSIKALDVVPSGECSSFLFRDTLDSYDHMLIFYSSTVPYCL